MVRRTIISSLTIVGACLIALGCKRDIPRAAHVMSAPKTEIPMIVSYELAGSYFEAPAISACKALNLHGAWHHECLWSGVRMMMGSESAYFESLTGGERSVLIVRGNHKCVDGCYPGVKSVLANGHRVRSIVYIPVNTPVGDLASVIEAGVRRAVD